MSVSGAGRIRGFEAATGHGYMFHPIVCRTIYRYTCLADADEADRIGVFRLNENTAWRSLPKAAGEVFATLRVTSTGLGPQEKNT